jgi:hypothetical protein
MAILNSGTGRVGCTLIDGAMIPAGPACIAAIEAGDLDGNTAGSSCTVGTVEPVGRMLLLIVTLVTSGTIFKGVGGGLT